MKILQLFLAFALAGGVFMHFAPAGHAESGVYYVATDGSDYSGNGSAEKPWATISKAVRSVPDGSTILVRPGTYVGQVSFNRMYDQGITIRSEIPYQARLRFNKPVLLVWLTRNVTIEGFDIAHSGVGAEAYIIQIQDVSGSISGCSDGECTQNIVLRNNILHDSYNNDIIKVNNGADNITIEGNIFYNQSEWDEHIDANSVTNIFIQDNIFFNDFAGSGRTDNSDTCSYVVIKDSNAGKDDILGAHDIFVRRNVMLNWQGSNGNPFVGIGEDGQPFYEGYDITVENNLFLGNSGRTMRAAFGVRGGRDITYRNNTVYGNLPSPAFAMRLNLQGDNLVNDNIHFYNNIWSDPNGTMEDFSDTAPAQTDHFTLSHNLYWNNGEIIPSDSAEKINYTNDAHRVAGNPQLGALPESIVLPRLNGNGTLADGSATIREAFEKLVNQYGKPSARSAALDAADPDNAPEDDILGKARSLGGDPDIGAFERAIPGFVDTLHITNTQQAAGTLTLELAWTPVEGMASSEVLYSLSPINKQNESDALAIGSELPGSASDAQVSVPYDSRQTLFFALRATTTEGDTTVSNNSVYSPQRSLFVPLVN